MALCNYIPLESAYLDAHPPYIDDIFDLDILCTEEGIFINTDSHEEA